MQSTAPLLRSVASAVSQAPSRIPHLRFHIALRRGRSRHTRHNGSTASVSFERKQSTFAPSEYAHRTVNTSETLEDVSEQARIATTAIQELSKESLSTIHDFSQAMKHVNMFDILEEGLRDRILSGLMSDSIGSPFIRQADDQMFKNALLALDPDYFVKPFKDLDRHLKGPRSANVLQTRSIDDRLAAFAEYLNRIVTLRRDSGWKLDLEACNHLLRCAASMGDAYLAGGVMSKIMLQDGVEPDLQSYNLYAQTLVWSHAFSSVENYQLRVLPRNLAIRASKRAPLELSGHTVPNEKRGTTGIRQEVLDIFKEITSKGLSPNELTFINLMISMGREGDVESVKSILKSVWNIDVNLLGAYDEEELESPTYHEQHHPLRPSEDILYTIAHVFGTNNDVRTAWLLVDFISRYYDLKVSEETWLQLCEWAFILSLRRSGSDSRQGKNIGRVPQEVFLHLLDTMQDTPHNVRPDATIRFLLSRSWRDKRHLDKTILQVQELKQFVQQNHTAIRAIGHEVIQYAQNAQRSGDAEAFANEEFYALRRRYMVKFLEFQRNTQLMNIAVHRNLLTESDWPGSGKLTEWERRKLPELVLEHAAFLPHILKYQTKTGVVELQTGYKQKAEAYAQSNLDYRVLPRIMNAMDTEDQAKLNRRMKALPNVIMRAKEYCFNCESAGHSHARCRKGQFPSTIFEHPSEKGGAVTTDNTDVLVLDPKFTKDSVPFSFEPGGEKEHSNPMLPFQ